MIDSSRVYVLAAIVLWVGLALVFSEIRWFRRSSLTTRLRPYADTQSPTTSPPTFTTLRQCLLPLATSGGEQIAKTFGIRDDLATRLQRADIHIDAGTFRIRQLGWALASTCFALLCAIAFRFPVIITLFAIAGAPLLAFLVLEQHVISATKRRQQRMFSELPVVAEQLATLLGAGYSLGASLNRIAQRNKGVTGDELRIVCERIRQGIGTSAALREWAARCAVTEVDRLVSILAFNSETADLGRLVSAEADAARREAQRRLAQLIDKRAQQVWIPVTVATLIPGVIFLAIPFLETLRQFSAN